MPRLTQPGGALWQMRTWYTAWRKLTLLTMVKRLRDKEGISLRKSAECVQVSAALLVKWEERFSLGNDPIKALLKTKKKSIHPGPLGQLKPLKEALLKYIFKKCKHGIKISTLAIVVVASNLSTVAGEHSFDAFATGAGAQLTVPAFFPTAVGKAETAFATGLGAPAIFAQSFFACAAGKAPTIEGMPDIISANADIAAISPAIAPRTFLRFGQGVTHIGQ
jgi:hypothetical protein